jgi:hypothetical protein
MISAPRVMQAARIDRCVKGFILSVVWWSAGQLSAELFPNGAFSMGFCRALLGMGEGGIGRHL